VKANHYIYPDSGKAAYTGENVKCVILRAVMLGGHSVIVATG